MGNVLYMLYFAILSVHRQVWFTLNVYCFTKVTRLLFCLPLSHIILYRDTDIVYRVPGLAVYRVPGLAVYRVPGSAVYRVPSRAVYRVPGLAVYRVPGRAVYRVPGRAVYRVPGRVVYRSVFNLLPSFIILRENEYFLICSRDFLSSSSFTYI